jgi:hypothetical protein
MSLGKDSYLGVWSLDEFLIPKHPFKFIQSLTKHRPVDYSPLLKHSLSSENTAMPCYILFRSRGLQLKHAFRHDEGGGSYPWIGVKFAADFQYLDLVNQTWLGAFNFMLPVDQSFQLGIPVEAVCQAQLENGDIRNMLANVERIDYDSDSAEFTFNSSNLKNFEGKHKYSFYDTAKKRAYTPGATMLYNYLSEGVESNKRHL